MGIQMGIERMGVKRSRGGEKMVGLDIGSRVLCSRGELPMMWMVSSDFRKAVESTA